MQLAATKKNNQLLFNLLVKLVCLTLETIGAVLGHIMQMERERNGVVAELQTRHVGCDRLIRRVQPPQICVEVASCPTGQSDVISLDRFPRLDGNLPGVV